MAGERTCLPGESDVIVPESLFEASVSNNEWLKSWLQARHSLEEVRVILDDCTRCRLHESRTNLVFGKGSPAAEVLLVGEAPGRQEDKRGEPFVGAAGRMLTKMINSIGLDRSEVYITNVVKSRPPNNRLPKPDEIQACLPYLKMEITIIKPKVICTLNRTAAHALLHSDKQLSRLRKAAHAYESIPVVTTYHPASLWRNPAWMDDAWDDMQMVLKILRSSKE